jgi:hypothetical protein
MVDRNQLLAMAGGLLGQGYSAMPQTGFEGLGKGLLAAGQMGHRGDLQRQRVAAQQAQQQAAMAQRMQMFQAQQAQAQQLQAARLQAQRQAAETAFGRQKSLAELRAGFRGTAAAQAQKDRIALAQEQARLRAEAAANKPPKPLNSADQGLATGLTTATQVIPELEKLMVEPSLWQNLGDMFNMGGGEGAALETARAIRQRTGSILPIVSVMKGQGAMQKVDVDTMAGWADTMASPTASEAAKRDAYANLVREFNNGISFMNKNKGTKIPMIPAPGSKMKTKRMSWRDFQSGS